MYKVTILLSGGIDSTVLLALLNDQNIECYPLFVDYGQVVAERERKASRAICAYYGLDIEEVDIKSVKHLSDNQLTNPTKSNNPFFPNRNLLLITLASIYAYENKHDGIAIGIIKAFNTIPFPDLKQEFFKSLSKTLSLSLNYELAILTPFIDMSKEEVVEIGKELNVPFALTYSCLTNNENHCGECESCKSRKEVLGEL